MARVNIYLKNQIFNSTLKHNKLCLLKLVTTINCGKNDFFYYPKQEIKKHIKEFGPVGDVKEKGETQKNKRRPENLDAFDCRSYRFVLNKAFISKHFLKRRLQLSCLSTARYPKPHTPSKVCSAEDITSAYIQA